MKENEKSPIPIRLPYVEEPFPSYYGEGLSLGNGTYIGWYDVD